MREAKLKAWVKERKIMADVLIINYKESTVQLPIETDVTDDYWWDETVWSFEEIELLQPTGLIDKNGKEIYEGDVVKRTMNDSHINIFTGKVIFHEGTYFIVCGSDCILLCPSYEREKNEIIGNIYQHPHLLEGE